MKLIFATHNKNKLLEIAAMMPSNFELLSLDDIGCTEEIPETATSIEGNAILKADYVKEHYNLDCFADDTGLEVDYLQGAPGVRSARYAGNRKNDAANIAKLLDNLKDAANRKAQFKTVIALNLQGHQILFIGICKGQIVQAPKGTFGFGYDSVFQPDGSDKTFGEMTLSEKSTFSHRGKALRDLLDYLGS